MKSKVKRYKNISWNPVQIKRWARAGKSIAEIARRCGYPENVGQNRVTRLLVEAGLWRVTKHLK